MAIVINEINNRSATLGIGENAYEQKFTRNFIATTSDPTIGQKAVISALGINIGDPYSTSTESDPFSFVKTISADQSMDSGGKVWTIRVEYEGYEVYFSNPNPLLDHPRVSWQFAQFQENVVRDINGDPILNTAFDQYAEPIQRDQSRPVLKIQRNEQTFNYKLAWQLKDTINISAFAGSDPHTVKVQDISADVAYSPTVGVYWVVNYEFHFHWTLAFMRVLPARLHESF